MSAAPPLFRLEGVHKGFGTPPARVEPLRGVSFEVRPGETLVLVGPSGTGKSVTLRLLIGLLSPDRGRVLYRGRDLADMGEADLDAMRLRMAMLFQSGALFDSMTVGENVAYPLRARGQRDEALIASLVSTKLAQVGLPGTESKMPSELSGGMRKRAALARSIVSSPEVIFYDEPTTGLDPVMSDAIADLLVSTQRVMEGLTSIVVTHDMNVALKTASRVMMLHDGLVVGEAPPEEWRQIAYGELPADAPLAWRMFRQFARGEAAGPIQLGK